MLSFQQRSYKKELLDQCDIPFAAIQRNMQELDFINRHLGGHDITLDGIVALVQRTAIFNKQLKIVEIGCGGGDNLRAVKDWAAHVKFPVLLTGIDSNPECIAFAREQQRNSSIQFVCSDYRSVSFPDRPDIVFSSLFCHHFTDAELVAQLQWMQENAALGFFINDLHRHPLAYWSIRLLTRLFSRSYLVRHDAPLSVQRGFRRRDWKRLFAAAQIKSYRCRWRWAFRWLITCNNHANAANI